MGRMTAAESAVQIALVRAKGGMKDRDHQGVPVWTRGPRVTLGA